jgi:hypothetical protein
VRRMGARGSKRERGKEGMAKEEGENNCERERKGKRE